MSSETLDFSQEPKKIFLAFLIKQMSLANFYIYDCCDEARGLNVLDGIIDSLNEDHQKALVKQHDLIVRGAYGKQRVEVRRLYSEVYRYLAKTYLEECNFGTVPTSTLKIEHDAPNEKIPIRVKAGL